jgi:hypothetical protein
VLHCRFNQEQRARNRAGSPRRGPISHAGTRENPFERTQLGGFAVLIALLSTIHVAPSSRLQCVGRPVERGVGRDTVTFQYLHAACLDGTNNLEAPPTEIP